MGLVPVFDGDKADTGVGLDTVFGDEAEAYAGGYQIQGSFGGIDGADEVFFRGGTACPVDETVAVIVEDHLTFVGQILGSQDVGFGQGVVFRQGREEIPLAKLPEMEASVTVGGVHDGHVKFFLANQIHQFLGGAFRNEKPDPGILADIVCHQFGDGTAEGAGDQTHPDHHRGADFAVPEGHGSSVQLLQGGIHPFPVVAALFRKPDIAAHFFKKLDAAQLRFQIVNGTAQGGLGNAQTGGGQRIVFHLRQHGEITKVIVVHMGTSESIDKNYK